MKNIIKYLFLTFICAVFAASAQQIQEADEMPVYQTEGSTMATSTVSGDCLLNRSSVNPANTLYGRLNGLIVLQGAGYGSVGEPDPTLYIRGIGTLSSNTPLVLVDGMERPLSTLVTEEIESVTILKDAVALALYGMRGANGVVLVTTKRGKEGKMDINVSWQHAFTTPTRLPKFANSIAYMDAVNEGLANEGLAPRYSNLQRQAYQNGNNPLLFPDVNWMDETFREWGHRDQINFSARGGTEKARYFSLINFISDRGLNKVDDANTDYVTRLMSTAANVRTNIDVNLTPSTLLQANLLARISEVNRPGAYTDLDLTWVPFNLPPNVYPVKNADGSWGGADAIYPMNPVAQSTATGYAATHARGIYADMLLKQDLGKFVEGLSVEGKIGFDAFFESEDIRAKQFLAKSVIPVLNESGAVVDTTINEYGRDDQELGFSTRLVSQNRFFDLQLRLNYDKEIGAGHLASFLLYRQDKKVLPGQNQTFLHQEITAFGHYSLKERYYFDLSLSAAGSARLPKNNHWGFLPAVGAAWRLSREAFLANAGWLDDLKLRLSFGLAGSDRIPYNLDLYPFVGGGAYIFGDNYIYQGGMTEGNLPAKKVTYEKNRMFNLGIESQFLQKIMLNVDVFFNKRYDIMVSRAGSISSILGATHAYAPDGEVKNHGFEIGIGISDQIGDFKYNIGGQFMFARNTIVNMNESFQPYDGLKRTGRPVGQLFGMETVGFFRDEADINQSPLQMFSNVYPGDFKYKDQNGDNQVDENDAVPIGYTNVCPEIYYSATLDLSYKKFGISALLQGIGNYSQYTAHQSLYFPLMSNATVSEHYLENCWRPGADNSGATYPRLTTTESSNNYRLNSAFIANASYLKLRSAEVYYKLPMSLISKVRVDECKLFFRGMDLFSIDQIKVLDPEARGIAYPSLKSFHLGFTLTF